jgi:hypothetical protein
MEEVTKEIINDDNDLINYLFPDWTLSSTDNYCYKLENAIIEYDFIFPINKNKTDTKGKDKLNSHKRTIIFKNCVFEKELKLFPNNITMKDKPKRLIFENCIFNNHVYLVRSLDTLTFDNCIFNNIFKAEDATLEGKIKFQECDFNEDVNFRNTKFVELADFWRSTFHKKTIFYKTDFLNTVVFSAATFKENVLFTYTLIDKLILFRGTKIQKGFDLSLAIIYGKLGLFGFDLNDYKDYQFINDEDEYEDAVSEKAIIPIKNKRETFRILKDVLESQKNLSESLKFKAIEKEVLRLELNNSNLNYKITFFSKLKFKVNNFLEKVNLGLNKYSNDYFSKLKFKVNNYLERLNLKLNKYSNDYGDSYGRAFLFVLFFGWLIFYLSLLSSETYSFSLNYENWVIKDNVKYFIEFLNPLHKSDYLEKEIILTPDFYIIDFFGKIIVGYGIYQFIQAFRKYK